MEAEDLFDQFLIGIKNVIHVSCLAITIYVINDDAYFIQDKVQLGYKTLFILAFQYMNLSFNICSSKDNITRIIGYN